jgi:hypothetical protein
MSGYGISNAMVVLVLIALVHGLLIRRAGEGGRAPLLPPAHPMPAANRDAFVESFVSPGYAAAEPTPTAGDGLQEMIEFASSNESWSACQLALDEGGAGPAPKSVSPCVRPESAFTNRALVNTYDDETVSNGAEIAQGLRGFEDWAGVNGSPLV